MIPDPGGLAAAAARQQQTPVVKVTVDWSGVGSDVDDITDHVDAVRISRQIAGDLPDAVTVVEGSSVAELTADLGTGVAADNALHAAALFSRVNPASPLYGKERLARPVTVDVGLETATGDVLVRRFTGLSADLSVSSTDRSAQLVARDYRELLRAKVAVPAVAAQVTELDSFGFALKPGLNAQWLVDYVYRANGFNASPPNPADTILSATMHGSAMPEVGAALNALWQDNDFIAVADPCLFEHGQFGYRLAGPEVVGVDNVTFMNAMDYELSRTIELPIKSWDYVQVEWWGDLNNAYTNLGTIVRFLGGGYVPISIRRQTVGGVNQLRVMYTRTFGGTTGIAEADLTATQHFAFSIQNRGASGRRIRIVQDGVTTVTDIADAGLLTDIPAMDIAEIRAYGPMEGLIITAGNTGGDVAPATSWGHTSEVDLGWSTNELVAALPSDKRDSWELLKELAQAEFAWLGFDENTGKPFYRTAEYWAETAQQTVSHTITADRDLLALALSDGIGQVRNQITVPVRALQVSPQQDVWQSDTYFFRPKTTKTFLVTFTDPLVELDTSVQAVIGGVPGTGFSRVRANTAKDGTGTDRSTYISVKVDFWKADTAQITVTSRYTQNLWLVDNTGAPALFLAGRQILVNDRTATAVYEEDAASVAEFGPQALDLPENQWRQDREMASDVASSLLGRLSQPTLTLTGMRVLGDPRRVLGDRVRIVDEDGTELDTEVWLTGCDDELSTDGGYTQTLNARAAWTTAVWGTSTWGDGTVWGP